MSESETQPGFPRELTESEVERLAEAFASKHRNIGIVIPHDALVTIILDTEMVVLGAMPITAWTNTY